MHFIGKDIDQYLSQREYVDTAVVPLLELNLNPSDLKSSAGASEYLQLLTALLEKQFKGRILLFPPLSYTSGADRERVAEEISAEMKKAEFKHVFYLTTDAAWRSVEKLENVLWLPAIPTMDMDRNFKQSVMEDQLRQVLPLFLKEWS